MCCQTLESIPHGLKPAVVGSGNAKAKALAYLEAKAGMGLGLGVEMPKLKPWLSRKQGPAPSEKQVLRFAQDDNFNGERSL